MSRGQFVSLLDPPAAAREAAAQCENVRTWPVLIGAAGERTVMLSSPIILQDYPEIAPESPGDLFDATEIDEILTLRTMALTDDEKREARAHRSARRRDHRPGRCDARRRCSSACTAPSARSVR